MNGAGVRYHTCLSMNLHTMPTPDTANFTSPCELRMPECHALQQGSLLMSVCCVCRKHHHVEQTTEHSTTGQYHVGQSLMPQPIRQCVSGAKLLHPVSDLCISTLLMAKMIGHGLSLCVYAKPDCTGHSSAGMQSD